MTTKIDQREAEVLDHMRHVSPLGREQIVWRARIIRQAEENKKKARHCCLINRRGSNHV